VRRKSGSFDLYYSGSRVYTSRNVTVKDIQITYDAIYLNMKRDYYEVPVISNNHGEKKTKLELLDHNSS
jgi:hypothetical protein